MAADGNEKVKTLDQKDTKDENSLKKEQQEEEKDPLAPANPPPPNSSLWYLLRLMTSTDLTLKRLASEMLFELCRADGK